MPASPSLNPNAPINKPKPSVVTKPTPTPKPSTSSTGGGTTQPAVTPKPKKKTKTQEEWAEYYQWSLALMRSDPSLLKVFQDAIKGNWKKDKFIAEVRRTKWFQTNGAEARKTIALKYSDPETWRQRVRNLYTQVQSLAGQLGVKASWQTYWDIAEDALMFGWDNTKLRSALAEYLKAGSATGGEAGEAKNQLLQYAYQMGIKLDDSAVNGWLKGIVNGSRTIEDYKATIQKQAISAFPTLADDIKGGLMVRDIASSYMESMGRILEVNSGDIDLFDPTIRKALTNVSAETGKAETKPLWQFEEELRKDPRWLKTNNARESINSVGLGVLQAWGFKA